MFYKYQIASLLLRKQIVNLMFLRECQKSRFCKSLDIWEDWRLIIGGFNNLDTDIKCWKGSDSMWVKIQHPL